jgi:hypothetical protein
MALAGKWQVDPGTDSMEEWLKALGWNIVSRKAAAAAKPSLDITHSPTEIQIHLTSTFKSGHIGGRIAPSEAAKALEPATHDLLGPGSQAWYADGPAVVHIFQGKAKHSVDRYYVQDDKLHVDKILSEPNGKEVLRIHRLYHRG